MSSDFETAIPKVKMSHIAPLDHQANPCTTMKEKGQKDLKPIACTVDIQLKHMMSGDIATATNC
ncbi:MAG: hypothetical protein R3F51_24690 [Cyanobacteriota/Melainabacteria group bacterium]